jgi:chromosome segregation ATPase
MTKDERINELIDDYQNGEISLNKFLEWIRVYPYSGCGNEEEIAAAQVTIDQLRREISAHVSDYHKQSKTLDLYRADAYRCKRAYERECADLTKSLDETCESAAQREQEILSILRPPDGRMTALEAARWIVAERDTAKERIRDLSELVRELTGVFPSSDDVGVIV